jgi:hypothetical protein
MMKRWMLAVLIALALAAVVVIVGFTQIKLDALQEPCHLETVVATQAKHLLVRWNSREGIPPAPANLQASIEEGENSMAPTVSCAMAPTATHSLTTVGGCIRALRISRRVRCDATPIENCSGL